MTPAGFDIPNPYAGLAVGAFIIAVAYLMCVDWTHTKPPEH